MTNCEPGIRNGAQRGSVVARIAIKGRGVDADFRIEGRMGSKASSQGGPWLRQLLRAESANGVDARGTKSRNVARKDGGGDQSEGDGDVGERVEGADVEEHR